MENDLLKEYRIKKTRIKQRIKGFERLKSSPYAKLFEELCFCICTPQSKAVLADKAIRKLKSRKALLKGSIACIRTCLGGVRFPNNKARYIKEAREIDLKNILKNKDDLNVRDEIVKKVKGLGYKEAGHFLRNIGRAKDLAILDVHILKNLRRLGVINEIPKTLSRKTYLNIENKMKGFSGKAGIPLRELDLLFWSHQTGHVFK